MQATFIHLRAAEELASAIRDDRRLGWVLAYLPIYFGGEKGGQEAQALWLSAEIARSAREGERAEADYQHALALVSASSTGARQAAGGAGYVVPERDGPTVWRIPRPYTHERIREMLRRLPCTFTGQAFWHRVEVFDRIDQSACCKYELREHHGTRGGAEPGAASDLDRM